MKRILLIVLLGCFFLGNVLCQTERSLFWEVVNTEQPDITHYLFGTIHLQDSALNCFSDEVWTALHSCDIVAGELDLTDTGGMMRMMATSVMKDTVLSQLYSEEDYNRLSVAVKPLIGEAQWPFYQKLKPFFLMGTLLTGLDTLPRFAQPMDMRFQLAAKKATGLESIDEQMTAVNSMSLKEQATMLLELALNPDSVRRGMQEMREVYLSQDIDRMQVLMAEMEMSPEMIDSFIHRRNEVMADRFIQLTGTAKVFCAVGAGHLGGETGLVNLLREKGFQVRPLSFRFLSEGCQ